MVYPELKSVPQNAGTFSSKSIQKKATFLTSIFEQNSPEKKYVQKAGKNAMQISFAAAKKENEATARVNLFGNKAKMLSLWLAHNGQFPVPLIQNMPKPEHTRVLERRRAHFRMMQNRIEMIKTSINAKMRTRGKRRKTSCALFLRSSNERPTPVADES